jgi:hypothetical protein
MTLMPRSAILLPLLAGILTGGCIGDSNNRITLSDSVGVTSLDPSVEETYLDIPTKPLEIYRSNWDTVTFLLPVDGTDHTYLGRTDMPCTEATARQRGEYPTPLSALDLDGDTGDVQAYEMVESHFWAAGDAILLVPRLIGWTLADRLDAVSPDRNYERRPVSKLTDMEREVWLGEPAR